MALTNRQKLTLAARLHPDLTELKVSGPDVTGKNGLKQTHVLPEHYLEAHADLVAGEPEADPESDAEAEADPDAAEVKPKKAPRRKPETPAPPAD